MNISGTPRVFLIVGDPGAQARAPEAFNHRFGRQGAEAAPVRQVPGTLSLFGFDGIAQAAQADPRRSARSWRTPDALPFPTTETTP